MSPKILLAILSVITAAACITQIGIVPLQDTSEEKKIDKSVPDIISQKNKKNFDDCGYEQIVVENPDKTKSIITIPLECIDELVNSVCDPLKDPIKNCVIDNIEIINH